MRNSHRALGRVGASLGLAGAILMLGACQKDEPDKAGETAAAPVPAAAAPTAGRPHLKAGLWKLAMDQGPAGETRMCIDDALQEKMSIVGGAQTVGSCRENVMMPKAGGYAFRSVCASPTGDGETSSEGEVTGDFNSGYRMRATVTTTGSSVASMNGSITVASEATWLGPCPADMKSGDIEMAGMRINMNEMTEKMTARPRPAR